MAKKIIDHFKPEGICLEPCRGGSAFYDLFPEGAEWCEIQEGRDFFDYAGNPDWIITNPPWSKIRQFYEKAFELGVPDIVFLININAVTTRARLNIIRNNGYGIKEFFCVENPKENWPQTGFQLAAVHVQKNYKGPTYWEYE